MQDIHSIGGGRLYSGGGDRRLRPHNQQTHQALKCPRCDSLNTKFCYYNNYNLSQPRHFCKSCRRYWTKGGVLRNVPVGGGCRKTKRSSKPKSSTDTSATQAQPAAPPPAAAAEQRERKTNSHNSSSESSSLTVTNTNVEAVSVHSSSSASNVLSVNNDCKFFAASGANNNNNNNSGSTGFETATPTTALLDQGSDGGLFSEIGSFTSLITSSSEPLSFEFGNLLGAQQSLEHAQAQAQAQAQVQGQQWQQQEQQQQKTMVSHLGATQDHQLKMQEMTAAGLLDQMPIGLSALQQDRSDNGGFGSLDWQGSGDQGLFDFTNVVDHASYWSQTTQWGDQDHSSLYLP